MNQIVRETAFNMIHNTAMEKYGHLITKDNE